MDQKVYVVDDDQAMAESLSWLIESDGLKVKSYPEAQSFLSEYTPAQAGCMVVDIRMPGMSGLELQNHLKNLHDPTPLIFISGHGDVSMAVRAMKMGAVDFLVKPFSDQAILEALHSAIKVGKKRVSDYQYLIDIRQRIGSLTPREREVMDLVVKGYLNKTISAELGIGCKTVEIHRARIMRKMRAKS